MNWIILPFIWALFEQQYLAGPVPLKLEGHTKKLTPYIKYWEAANYDRTILENAHQKHIEQKHHRWKRSMNAGEYGPAHVIRLNFFAHDKEFKVVLKQDPLSVFASDVQFENTHGPIDFDISRIYTGSLEEDDLSRVHAVLTNDNLIDGTIETNSDYYYIEPTHRYAQDLYDAGIHSIIYKLNDVDMKRHKTSLETEHCASERLHWKRQNQNDSNVNNDEAKHSRKKRWLPEEYLRTNNERRDPPLPLDLDVPYNDDMSILTDTQAATVTKEEANFNQKSKDYAQNRLYKGFIGGGGSVGGNSNSSRTPFRRGGDNYKISNRSYDRTNTEQKFYTKHKNIIVSTYDNSNSNNNFNRSNYFDRPDEFLNIRNGNVNKTTLGNDRPSHKTHVEIITKDGGTRNIIVNNYNPPPPELTANAQHPHFNSMLMTNLLSNKGINSDFSSSSTDSLNSRNNRKITCMLYLQADHTFFQKMGSDEASIEAITRHVQRANSIYKNTDFNNDGKPDNITFMIKRIKVHNMNALNDPAYRFPGNYGVEKFLELFSEEDYDAFCLAYMFTYRDFEMGTLGLAWTGDLKNAGGVCEKNGHYRGSLKSLNTGIVTLLNYGKHVPPAVSHVTLAHEIGHNFGSPHDPEKCTPGGEDGNFIMFARATSGDKKNNNKFSPCSLNSIEPVLNNKARSSKGCFTEPQTSICGNGVVEPGEECDCGWEEDCKDTCCFPMSRHPRMDERPCTLTPGSLCSQSQGPCCTQDCRLKFGDKCRDDNGCRDPSFCDGRMPQCPPSVNKPNKTICNKEFVCYMGECTGSICLAYGLESCQCIPGENDDKIKSCELCCKLPGEDKPCRSSFEWNEAPYDVPNMYAKPGTPCNDYNGYCDVFQKCREVDPSGPLATLRKLLLSEESIATFKNWMQSNWYTVVLAAIAIVVLLILSTKLLAKRSNLKLKTVTIIHSATTETVRLPADNNGVIVHRAVRTKVPFKKKVRGKRNINKKKIPNIRNSGKDTKETGTGTGAGAGAETFDNLSTQRIQQQQLHKKANSNGTAINTPGPIIETKESIPAVITSTTNGAISKSNSDKSNNIPKKTSHSRKHSKEIIDYSKRNSHIANKRGSLSTSTPHTNTFHKVQKWLLESPIVAQPLSHIEHSSKVRKVMSKSQSTPERLLHKSPLKSKSMNNMANDKVRMQVVYKPFKFSPFKFSLRFSKNAKVRTHVLGGGGNKSTKASKQPSKSNGGRTKRSPEQHQQLQSTNKSQVPNEKNVPQTRTAFLLQKQNNDDDNQILTAGPVEPNYETLKNENKSLNSNPLEEHAYEIATNDLPPLQTQLSRISSTTTQRTVSKLFHPTEPTTRNSFIVDAEKLTNMQKARDMSGSSTSINKFGSTQNLIKSKEPIFTSSKNRNSIHSRSNKLRDIKDSALASVANTTKSLYPDNSIVLPKQSSGKILPNPVQRPIATRSANNIPRASVFGSFANANANEAEKSNNGGPPLPPPPVAARGSLNNMPPAIVKTSSSTSIPERMHQRSNSLRQQPHSFVPPPLPRNSVPNDEKLCTPSDMDQSISDIEYLVS